MEAVNLIAGTRGSRLALWQTSHVLQTLASAWPHLVCRTQQFETRGDTNRDTPLPEIGGKGLFTAELEQALREERVDIAVHSLKDLPTEPSPGLMLGAILRRATAGDVLVGPEPWTLTTLPHGARVGTSSLRRAAQLRRVRPDLVIQSIRGNVDTRIRKVWRGDYDAAVMAAAGLERLGLTDRIASYLDLDDVVPAAGQGALAIQCREKDERTLNLLAPLNDDNTRRATEAERMFLSTLGGGCATPIGAFAQVASNGMLTMDALVASLDGALVIRVQGEGANPHELGQRLAQEALERGAGEVLSHA